MDLGHLKAIYDYSQVDKGAKAFDNLGKSAKDAEGKTKNVNDTLKGMSDKGGMIGGIADKMQGLAGASGGASTGVSGLAGAIGIAAGAATVLVSAAVAAAGAVYKLTMSVVDSADALNDLSNRTNISTERLSVLDAVAKMAGSNVEELVSSSERLGQKLAKQDEDSGRVVKALRELGVSTKDANGETKSMLKLQEDIVLAVDAAGNSAKAQGLAVLALGNEYYKLRTPIKEAAESQSQMYDYMRKVGAITTTDLAKRSDELNDKISKLGLAFQGMGKTVASVVLPYLDGIVSRLTTIFEKAADLVRRYGGGETASEATEGQLEALQKRRADLEKALAGDRNNPNGFGSPATIARNKEWLVQVNDAIREMQRFKTGADAAAESAKNLATGSNSKEGNRVVGGQVGDAAGERQRFLDKQMREALERGRQLNGNYQDGRIARESPENRMQSTEIIYKQNKALEEQRKKWVDLVEPTAAIQRQIDELSAAYDRGEISWELYADARLKLEDRTLDILNKQKTTQNTFASGWADAFAQYAESATNAAKIGADAFSQTTALMENALTKFIETGKLGFKEFLQGFLKMIAGIVARWAVLNVISLATGGGTVPLSAMFPASRQANGGAWSGGTQFFANGGVVDSPTAFGMAGGGMGVMGEAGPEAIMPLKRTSSGKLGVIAMGGGGSHNGPLVSNEIHIQIGSVDSKERKDEMMLEIKKTIRAESNAAIYEAMRRGNALNPVR